jgi:hypothetical protein
MEESRMKLYYLGHALAATAVVFAGVMTVRLFGALPSWLGVVAGLVLYGLTLWIATAEEAP